MLSLGIGVWDSRQTPNDIDDWCRTKGVDIAFLPNSSFFFPLGSENEPEDISIIIRALNLFPKSVSPPGCVVFRPDRLAIARLPTYGYSIIQEPTRTKIDFTVASSTGRHSAADPRVRFVFIRSMTPDDMAFAEAEAKENDVAAIYIMHAAPVEPDRQAFRDRRYAKGSITSNAATTAELWVRVVGAPLDAPPPPPAPLRPPPRVLSPPSSSTSSCPWWKRMIDAISRFFRGLFPCCRPNG